MNGMHAHRTRLALSSVGATIALGATFYLLVRQAVFSVTVDLSSPINDGLGVNTVATLTATAVETRLPWVIVVAAATLLTFGGMIARQFLLARVSSLGLFAALPAVLILPSAQTIAAAGGSSLKTVPAEMFQRHFLDARLWTIGVAIAAFALCNLAVWLRSRS
jgi:hypothetical protein